MTKTKKFLYSLMIVTLTAYISSYFTNIGTSGWYQLSPKPFLTPVDYFFPIIWTILYTFMIISFYVILRVYNKKHHNEAIPLFLSQLLLQIIWCYIFFVKAYFFFAFIIILILIADVIFMIISFYKINKFAAQILYPYGIWLIFAGYLNFSFIFI